MTAATLAIFYRFVSRNLLKGLLWGSFGVGLHVSAQVVQAPVKAFKADATAGERIAREGVPPQVAACVSCHGVRGEGSPAFPPLAATGSAYLQAQLDAFASATRANAIMGPIAKALTAAQRADVSAWFASLPSPLSGGKPETADPQDAGAWLAQRGRWEKGVPACAQCHGASGLGVGDAFPPIAGLSAAYMQEQIAAWKADSRPPGPLGLMKTVAAQLSDEDVTAVAAYYAKLRTNGTAPASTSAEVRR